MDPDGQKAQVSGSDGVGATKVVPPAACATAAPARTWRGWWSTRIRR
jgi:hypothetical protein